MDDAMDNLDDMRTMGPTSEGPEKAAGLPDGTTLGQYRLIGLLGRGGMGEVYEAEHTVLGRRYALKLLPADFAERSEALGRFQREAQVMANLEHPNIVRVDEFGETDGRYWLRMEFMGGIAVDGKQAASLAELATARGGRLAADELLGVLRQVLDGLAYAHEHGAVHRDLKPANILLADSGAKIGDFGLVRLIGEEWVRGQAELSLSHQMSVGDMPTMAEGDGTSTRALLGTYDYMSPEQKAGKEVDERSDVYSVGLMTYRLLTGRELGMKTPSQIDPTLAPAWDAFVVGALEQEPEDRYPNASAMRAALAALEAPAPEEAPAPPPAPTEVPTPPVEARAEPPPAPAPPPEEAVAPVPPSPQPVAAVEEPPAVAPAEAIVPRRLTRWQAESRPALLIACAWTLSSSVMWSLAPLVGDPGLWSYALDLVLRGLALGLVFRLLSPRVRPACVATITAGWAVAWAVAVAKAGGGSDAQFAAPALVIGTGGLITVAALRVFDRRFPVGYMVICAVTWTVVGAFTGMLRFAAMPFTWVVGVVGRLVGLSMLAMQLVTNALRAAIPAGIIGLVGASVTLHYWHKARTNAKD